MGIFDQFSNAAPFTLAGSAEGLLAGRQQSIAQANVEAARAIDQQNADSIRQQAINQRTAPARQMAATLYGNLSGLLTDPERYAIIQGQNLVPFLYDAVKKLGKAAQDGDLSVFNTLDPENLRRLIYTAGTHPGQRPTGTPGGPDRPFPETAGGPGEAPPPLTPAGPFGPNGTMHLAPEQLAGFPTPPQTRQELVQALTGDRALTQPDATVQQIPYEGGAIPDLHYLPGAPGADPGLQNIPNPATATTVKPPVSAPVTTTEQHFDPQAPDSLQGQFAPQAVAARTGGGGKAPAPGKPFFPRAQPSPDPVPQPKYDENAPARSALNEIDSRVASIGHQIVGLDPHDPELKRLSDDFLAGMRNDRSVARAQEDYDRARDSHLYSPDMRLHLAANLHQTYQNVLTDRLAVLNAGLTRWTTAAAVNKTQAEALANLGQAMQAAGAGFKDITASNLAPGAQKIEQEKAWTEAAKPLVDRIQARIAERSMEGSSSTYAVGGNLTIGPVGIGARGSKGQSERESQARAASRSQISDIMALRELGRGGNKIAAEMARGFLTGARAEYFGDPASWSAVPPTDQVLRGLDYLHATDREKAAFTHSATTARVIQRRQDITAAEKWQKQTQIDYYSGPRYGPQVDRPAEREAAATRAALGRRESSPLLSTAPILPPVAPGTPGTYTPVPPGPPPSPFSGLFGGTPDPAVKGALERRRSLSGTPEPEPAWVHKLSASERASMALAAKRVNEGLPKGSPSKLPPGTDWSDWHHWPRR